MLTYYSNAINERSIAERRFILATVRYVVHIEWRYIFVTFLSHAAHRVK